jgi:polysaccharide biosynthesis/export protein
MQSRSQWSPLPGLLLIGAICACGTGCMGMDSLPVPSGDGPCGMAPMENRGVDPYHGSNVPREMNFTSLPPYILEPPDILLINMVRVVPKPPYRIESLDTLLIQVTKTLPNEPISGLFAVDPDGTVNLGPSYGLVSVAGLTLEEAQEKILTALAERVLKNPHVSVSLASAHGMQQIQGEHLVRPDGTVGLGTYGSVYVAGRTLDQARHAIEAHLARSLLQPEISIDVYAYNSKYCYVIADGAGYGQQIIRLPITGKETVLDAISQIYGLPQVSSSKYIWVARPNGHDPDQMQILPVDWGALTMGGSPATNYQLFPGDRVYIQANWLICLNNRMAQLFAPIERVFGITLLGSATVNAVTNATTRNTSTTGGTGF